MKAGSMKMHIKHGSIYSFLRSKYPLGYTRNEINTILGIRLTSVCARVNALIEAKWLTEIGEFDKSSRKVDPITGRNNSWLKWNPKN